MAESFSTAKVKLVEETCRVPGCERPRNCRGVCKRHHDRSRHARGHEVLQYMLPAQGAGPRPRGRPSSAAPGRDAVPVGEKPVAPAESSIVTAAMAADILPAVMADIARHLGLSPSLPAGQLVARVSDLVAHRDDLVAQSVQWRRDLAALKSANEHGAMLERDLAKERAAREALATEIVALRQDQRPRPPAVARVRFIHFVDVGQVEIVGEVTGAGKVPLAESVDAIEFDVVPGGGS